MKFVSVFTAAVLVAPVAIAQPVQEHQDIAPGVHALVGPFGQRDPQNLGNNATFGLVVTPDGAVLIDAGGSMKGAKALHAAIRQVTDQPVRYVINTGGQDHRWIGNSYWQGLGATVIAAEDAVADQHDRASMQLTVLAQLIGDGVAGTEPAYADITFADRYDLSLGGIEFQIVHPGPAHTPGDSFVWLPESRTVFTGDIVYVGRILGVMDHSSSADWVESFDAFATLEPAHVVPGHGPVTDLATARRDTRDYLVNLRSRIGEHIEAGGDIIGAVDVDQSGFAYLDSFDQLSRRNAQEVFSQMEWE
ncbi:SoxH protein [Rhodovulum sp. P5]|uniref:MBL fold metallo-hydrolase n=1 Tax=Rhodovulum sp. P5 TaxID=1564506 RepID=UPI0009C1DC89|nr:MBL fold metallo-hydrolase [Rhodovulum sp. P5]ARE39459.1 SoxH protein [Rhodovulum sp. P5]